MSKHFVKVFNAANDRCLKTVVVNTSDLDENEKVTYLWYNIKSALEEVCENKLFERSDLYAKVLSDKMNWKVSLV